MSLGIIQKERTAYGRAKVDGWGGGVEEWWERNPQQSLVKLHNEVLSSLTVVYETTDWQRAFERLHLKNVKMR